jgi:ribonucleoside-diphosphate reductase alpha chain
MERHAMSVIPFEPEFSENAMRALTARYLRKDVDGNIVETPAQMLGRVAAHVAGAERALGGDAEEARSLFYEAMARRLFLPNSPALMNAGRTLGVLSACFVLPVDDSVQAIFESVMHTARIQQAGGGTGFSFDRLRPAGDHIASSGGRTSGPMSFWRVFAEATRAIQQGAFRRGANMGMMSVRHPDMLKFIAAKRDLTQFENFNISVKVPNDFMDLLRRSPHEPHVVVNPRTGERYWLPRNLRDDYLIGDLRRAQGDADGCLTVGEIWTRIVTLAHATGEPGLCFIDRVNDDNPTPRLGSIEATNPCGEQPLLDYEACTLGSIDISKLMMAGQLNEPAFRGLIRLAVRFLDDVVEVDNHLIEPISRVCRGNRKIGLGLMGFADALMEAGIPYACDEAIAFGERLARILVEEATEASALLAHKRGVFPNYAGSLWEARGTPMRNAAVTTIAPTGTLSLLAGCSGGIEPAFALAFHRRVLGGQDLLEVSAPFERLARRMGFWSEALARELASGRPLAELVSLEPPVRELLATAHEIPPRRHVEMQAAFQRHIDGAISKTINLPAGAAPADVDEVFRLAHALGCKGVTVYRDRSRAHQPMAAQDAAIVCPQCRTPIEAQGCVRCPVCGATLCT